MDIDCSEVELIIVENDVDFIDPLENDENVNELHEDEQITAKLQLRDDVFVDEIEIEETDIAQLCKAEPESAEESSLSDIDGVRFEYDFHAVDSDSDVDVKKVDLLVEQSLNESSSTEMVKPVRETVIKTIEKVKNPPKKPVTKRKATGSRRIRKREIKVEENQEKSNSKEEAEKEGIDQKPLHEADITVEEEKEKTTEDAIESKESGRSRRKSSGKSDVSNNSI